MCVWDHYSIHILGVKPPIGRLASPLNPPIKIARTPYLLDVIQC